MALVSANLLGLLGVVIAAPMLATLQLFARYVLRKMFDQDAWPEEEYEPRSRTTQQTIVRLRRSLQRARDMTLTLLQRRRPLLPTDPPESQNESESEGENS
jgi:hypothetical protein